MIGEPALINPPAGGDVVSPTEARQQHFPIDPPDVLGERTPVSAPTLKWILLVMDFAVLVGAGAVVAAGGVSAIAGTTFWLGVVAYALLTVVTLYVLEGYDRSVCDRSGTHLLRVLAALGATTMGIALLHSITPSSAPLPTPWLELSLWAAVMMVLWRGIGASIIVSRIPPRRVVVVGAGNAARELLSELAVHPEYEVVALLDDDEALWGTELQGIRVLGSTEKLSTIFREQNPDVVAVAITHEKSSDLLRRLIECRYAGAQVLEMAGAFETLTKRLPIRHLHPSWVAFSSRFNGALPAWDNRMKRVMDVAAATAGFALLLPVMVTVGLLILIISERPILYRQARVGKHGKTFTIFKFRTMHLDSELDGEPKWASAVDPRITPLGRILRRTHLDELPQLWNILRGDMALVGPRPERPEFVEKLREVIPLYDLRHMIKPGLTGWAQIRYPYGASVADATRKLEFDLYYLRHRTVLWDIRIVLRTFLVAIVGRGSR